VIEYTERETASYRGHEIEAHREESLAGFDLLYWSIFRESDGYECDSGFTYDDSLAADYVDLLKQRVDAELNDENPWRERDE